MEIVKDRFKKSNNKNLAHWLSDFSTWDKNKFAGEVKKAMHDAYGIDVKFDEHLISMLSDQMQSYVLSSKALAEEEMVEPAINGTRMVNPNYKVRDASLARVLQIFTSLGLLPNGRPKKKAAPTEIDDILAGPKAA